METKYLIVLMLTLIVRKTLADCKSYIKNDLTNTQDFDFQEIKNFFGEKDFNRPQYDYAYYGNRPEVNNYDDYYYSYHSFTTKCHNVSNTTQHLQISEQYHDIDFQNSRKKKKVILIITESNIPSLPPTYFVNNEMFTVLNLSNLYIENIMPAAFNNFNRLKEIYLNDNKLTKITVGVFNSLHQLNVLDLSDNNIADIADQSFVGMVNLKKLFLNKNKISVIFKYLFGSNLVLEELNLSDNLISVLPDLRNLTSMQTLDMSNNLSLTTDLQYLNDLKTLLTLRLSFNKISSIPSEAFRGLISLTVLDVSNNYVSSIASDSFAKLNSLQRLYLQNNKLDSLPHGCFSSLSSLTHLNLSNNELQQFDYGTFDSLRNLQSLDISNNQLKEFPTYVYHSLTSLQILNLANNKLTSIDALDLVSHLINLVDVNLYGDIWSCDELLKIIHRFDKNKQINVVHGQFFNGSNIHGIPCFGNLDTTEINLNSFQTVKSESENVDYNFKNSLMYNYFNKDFQGSNFFKYLESLRKPQILVQKIADENNQTNVAKLISYFNETPKGNDNIQLRLTNTVNMLLLISILCVLCYMLYISRNRNLNKTIKNEQTVELI